MTRRECNRILLESLAPMLQMGPMCSSEELDDLMRLGITRDEAMEAVLLTQMGFDMDSGLGKEIYRGYLPGMIRGCCAEMIVNDLYVQAVGKIEYTEGNKHLTMDTLDAFQLFVRNDFEMDAQGRVLPQLGYFEKPVAFPVLLEDGFSWMSTEPNEVATLRPLAEQAHGRVVMMGLGLGYYAYHALLNADVSSVTVIERDEETITLFEKALLPVFPRKDCLKIVHADAFDYAQHMVNEYTADTVLVDLWKTAGDGIELYTRMKQLETPGPKWQYWIEKTIQYYLKG